MEICVYDYRNCYNNAAFIRRTTRFGISTTSFSSICFHSTSTADAVQVEANLAKQFSDYLQFDLENLGQGH